jgi:hypothetical protein
MSTPLPVGQEYRKMGYPNTRSLGGVEGWRKAYGVL